MQFQRYAIYYTPKPGPLATFGADWLGWDSARGRVMDRSTLHHVPANIDDLTEHPRRYGFHGTLKPPFRLARGKTAGALEQACQELASTLVPIRLGHLVLSRIGTFLALTPEGEATALGALAARVVRTFDPFRVPPNAAELERHRLSGLTPSQEALLTRWGYPYVMEEFRFHMTLTGSLQPAEIDVTMDTLASEVSAVLPDPLIIDDFTLAGEDADGNFHEIDRFPFGA